MSEFDSCLQKTFLASRYVERLCIAHPALLLELRNCHQQVFTLAEMNAATQLPPQNTQDFDTALRKLRQRVMLRLIFRDINCLCDFDEVVTTISHLADASVNAAIDFHRPQVAAAMGLDEQALADERSRLLVVGMGKLGARELNVSSDIDLIFVFASDGDASSTRSWHEFHSELGKRVIRSLDAVDENGFVFRTDMRLRPFGDAGPLVVSLPALHGYFLNHARPWERYAWLKARAISGGANTIRALFEMVTPFVYRRYHDYAAINEMRELHAQIRAEATRRNKLTDIKVGPGGIREVEFVIQLHQLIRGGRDPELQIASTRGALQAVEHCGLLPPERARPLLAAYLFLRNLEHRLQYADDQQTQALPRDEAAQARLAVATNFQEWTELIAALDQHRGVVTREFDNLFAASTVPNPASSLGSTSTSNQTALEVDVHARLEQATQTQQISADEAGQIKQRVQGWQVASRTQTLTPRTRNRIEHLIPHALAAALTERRPATTVLRLLDLLDAIDKRETYLALLSEYPEVLQRIAHLTAESAWAADLVKRHPVLLDELRLTRHQSAIDWPTERAQLHSACRRLRGDTEQLYELLRHTKQVLTLRLNIADIEGRLGVMALSDALSALADMLLEATLALTWQAISPAPADTAALEVPPGFAIIGYGKLGSKELGYASDLDLVFLYDQNANIPADQYGRLAQRLNSWLNATTAGGVLYETDLRLRPDGAAGLLVSSLDAFANYQLTRAWTWEHQALTRARWCAGDRTLMAPFESLRAEILCRERDATGLRAEIVAMREKMRSEKKDRADALDLKHTRGGIVDVEFIVQYLILAHAHEHAEFLGNLGNHALLLRAGALGLLEESLAAGVAKAYLDYRERQHHARTNNEAKTWIGLNELENQRRAVTVAWRTLLGATGTSPAG